VRAIRGQRGKALVMVAFQMFNTDDAVAQRIANAMLAAITTATMSQEIDMKST